MKIIPRASQETDVVTLPADGTAFVFFGADSSLPVNCFDCSIISDFLVDYCDVDLGRFYNLV